VRARRTSGGGEGEAELLEREESAREAGVEMQGGGGDGGRGAAWRGSLVGLRCGRGGELREFGWASPAACGGCERVTRLTPEGPTGRLRRQKWQSAYRRPADTKMVSGRFTLRA
jgi:hypothetical protein